MRWFLACWSSNKAPRKQEEPVNIDNEVYFFKKKKKRYVNFLNISFMVYFLMRWLIKIVVDFKRELTVKQIL